MRNIIALGRFGVQSCTNLGNAGLLLFKVLARRPKWAQGIQLTIEQIYAVGVLSLLIILVSALFIGMVLGLQGFNTLQRFGATQQLGQLVALSVVRELGPVVTALLFAGRAGSALAAELGLMRATEQIASMEMMAVDPLWRVIYPRLWAGFLSLPLLALVFSAVSIYGGYLIAVQWLGLDGGSFWSNMSEAVNFRVDVWSGILKSIVFGFVVTWIAVYQGYDTVPTAEGISRATTRTVVFSSLAILGLDFVLTATMIGGW